jgi:YesN/AraC family two-component response regulator
MGKGVILVLAEGDMQGCRRPLKQLDEICVFYPLDSEITRYLLATADLVIIDCQLLVDQGLQLLRFTKQQRPGTPVIFITAATSEDTVIQALKGGAREYFKKPIESAALINSVENILRLKRETNWTHIPLMLTEKKETLGILKIDGMLPERLLRAINFIEFNLSNHLCLEDIARQACLSKFHFCRLFKQHLKISPKQFILNLRICRATNLIRCTNLSITSVATKSGFSDLSDFYRQFKKINGMPPSDFRNTIPPR